MGNSLEFCKATRWRRSGSAGRRTAGARPARPSNPRQLGGTETKVGEEMDYLADWVHLCSGGT